jgi:hypothetical protein
MAADWIIVFVGIALYWELNQTRRDAVIQANTLLQEVRDLHSDITEIKGALQGIRYEMEAYLDKED